MSSNHNKQILINNAVTVFRTWSPEKFVYVTCRILVTQTLSNVHHPGFRDILLNSDTSETVNKIYFESWGGAIY